VEKIFRFIKTQSRGYSTRIEYIEEMSREVWNRFQQHFKAAIILARCLLSWVEIHLSELFRLTCDDGLDVPVPGQKDTFGVVKAAQARGDFRVLAERKRRALRVHLGADVQAGLATLQAAIRQALA